ncbi:MAG: hypothetical protein ACRC57_04465 [Sarcina sp.]
MEENILTSTLTYVGMIGTSIYADLVYPAGFVSTTAISINTADTPTVPVSFDLVHNYKYYNDTTLRTIIIPNGDPTENYIVTIDGINLSLNIVRPNAQVSSNVTANVIGTRILQVAFDEPMQNLATYFDFAIDRKNNFTNSIYVETDTSEYLVYIATPIQTASVEPKILAVEKSPGNYHELKFTGSTFTINSTPLVASNYSSFIATNSNLPNSKVPPALKSVRTKPIYIFIDSSNNVTYSYNETQNFVGFGYSIINSAFTNTPSDNCVLSNFYFKYYGRDDEGTLYEPLNKPLSWLGYFASKDITVTVSPDNRVLEIQINDYDLPETLVNIDHQLVINYAKTFPHLTNESRIQDATNNLFPIAALLVNITKPSMISTLTNVVALSRTEVILTYSKEVMLITDPSRINYHPNINILKINGAPLYIKRIEGSLNQLLGTIQNPSDYALPIGENIPVTISSTLDRCAYITDEVTFNIPVTDVLPNVISLTQVTPTIDYPEDTVTVLKVIFDQIMLKSTTPVDNFNFAEMIDGIPNPIFPTDIKINMNSLGDTTTTQSNIVYILIGENPLFPATEYQVNIKNLTNSLGTPMNPYTGYIFINDLSAPYIKEVLLSQQNAKIVVKYNEPMNVNMPNSMIDATNYQLISLENEQTNFNPNTCLGEKIELSTANVLSVISTKHDLYAILDLTSINDLNFTIGTPITTEPPVVSHYIKAGYCDIKAPKYIVNKSNNVLDFVCPASHYLVSAFNFEETSPGVDLLSIITLNAQELTIQYTGTTKNEFFNILPQDFSVTNNGGSPISAISYELIDSLTIKLTFPTGSLEVDTPTTPLTLSCTPTASFDIFNNLLPSFNNRKIDHITTATHINKIALIESIGTTKVLGLQFTNNVQFKPSTPAPTATDVANQFVVKITDTVTGNSHTVYCTNAEIIDSYPNSGLINRLNLTFVDSIYYESPQYQIKVISSQSKFLLYENNGGASINEPALIFDYTPVNSTFVGYSCDSLDYANGIVKFNIDLDDSTSFILPTPITGLVSYNNNSSAAILTSDTLFNYLTLNFTTTPLLSGAASINYTITQTPNTNNYQILLTLPSDLTSLILASIEVAVNIVAKTTAVNPLLENSLQIL